MSDKVDAPAVDPAAEAKPKPRRSREALIAAACLVVICIIGLTVSGVFSSATSDSTRPLSTGSTSLPRSAQARLDAIRALLLRRSAALVDHRRAAFLATIDPDSRSFRRTQGRMFTNLRRVHFASWSYDFDLTNTPLPAAARRRYDAPTWAPTGFKLHYRITGFDKRPTDLPQYPTFVKRSGEWYLGSLTDFAKHGSTSATDLWDYAPVHVIRRPSVLVLGPASELGTMATVADLMQAAIPKVTGVWGRDWARQVVVLVPSTEREMALIDADTDDLDQIAALTSSEVSSVRGKPAPVGDRVTINPANWSKLGPLGASIVLTHELTHVATRADTGTQTPKWLSEGFAEYVGFLNTDVPVTVVAAELASRVRAGQLEKRLPTDHDFRGANQNLSQAYESGWLACRYLADRYGQGKLVRFYRAVGTSTDSRAGAVSAALHQVFHLTPHRFTALWRAFVTAQLT